MTVSKCCFLPRQTVSSTDMRVGRGLLWIGFVLEFIFLHPDLHYYKSINAIIYFWKIFCEHCTVLPKCIYFFHTKEWQKKHENRPWIQYQWKPAWYTWLDLFAFLSLGAAQICFSPCQMKLEQEEGAACAMEWITFWFQNNCRDFKSLKKFNASNTINECRNKSKDFIPPD